MLTETTWKMTLPDGITNEMTVEPGDAERRPSDERLADNKSEEPGEVTLVEIKDWHTNNRRFRPAQAVSRTGHRTGANR
jgi:hypothetical protein